jgi:hypothetical protein
MMSYWLSSNRMTVIVDTDDDGIIVYGSPIVRKFIGQHLANLISWLDKQGGLLLYKYSDETVLQFARRRKQ